MKQRIISGAVLVVLALAVILAGDWILAATLFLISCVAFRELAKATGVHTEAKKVNGLEAAGYAGITVYYGLLYFGKEMPADGQELMAISVLACMMLMMAVYVFSFPRYKAHQVFAAVFSLVYAPVMLGATVTDGMSIYYSGGSTLSQDVAAWLERNGIAVS